MLRSVLDFIEEQEVMVVVNALVLGLTTPEEVDRRKYKATRRVFGSKVKVANVIHGVHPDFLYSREPIWRCTGITEALYTSLLGWVTRAAISTLAYLAPRPACMDISWSHGRCRIGSPASLILFSLFLSLCLNPFVGLKVSKRFM